MSDALDILCKAGGRWGSVQIHNRRVSVFSKWLKGSEPRLLDFESYEWRSDCGRAIRVLSGRVTPQRQR